MKGRDVVYLKQIFEAISVVSGYIMGKNFSDFELDQMLQDAVVRKIEIIGEGARRMSDEFIEAHRELPLIAAISMRNRLIHEYEDIDLKVVWDTVSVDLPKLGGEIEKILAL